MCFPQIIDLLGEPRKKLINTVVPTEKKQDEPISQVNIALCNLKLKDRQKQSNTSIIANNEVHAIIFFRISVLTGIYDNTKTIQ